jgi:hypothetical protein
VQNVFYGPKDNSVMGLGFQGKEFALFECPLGLINFSGKKSGSKTEFSGSF